MNKNVFRGKLFDLFIDLQYTEEEKNALREGLRINLRENLDISINEAVEFVEEQTKLHEGFFEDASSSSDLKPTIHEVEEMRKEILDVLKATSEGLNRTDLSTLFSDNRACFNEAFRWLLSSNAVIQEKPTRGSKPIFKAK